MVGGHAHDVRARIAQAEQGVGVFEEVNDAFATSVEDRDVDQGREVVAHHLIAE